MLDPYRILVTGSRTFTDKDTVHGVLLGALPLRIESGRDYVFVHGDCDQGPDSMVGPFCEDNAWWVDNAGGQLYAEPHPADWNTCADHCHPAHRKRRFDGTSYCPAAGLRRDDAMVALGAQICVAFIAPCVKPACRKRKPHGSHGASHTARIAEKAGIPTRRFP